LFLPEFKRSDFRQVEIMPPGITSFQSWRLLNNSYSEETMKARLVLVCIMGAVLGLGLFSTASAQVTEEWVARYNGPDSPYDVATSLAIDGDGNVYVTGTTWGGSMIGSNYITIKYNPAGIEQWVRLYNGPGNGSDDANSLAVDGDGNVYVTGISLGGGHAASTMPPSSTTLPASSSGCRATTDREMIKIRLSVWPWMATAMCM
jgi:hypothetical protein